MEHLEGRPTVRKLDVWRHDLEGDIGTWPIPLALLLGPGKVSSFHPPRASAMMSCLTMGPKEQWPNDYCTETMNQNKINFSPKLTLLGILFQRQISTLLLKQWCVIVDEVCATHVTKDQYPE